MQVITDKQFNFLKGLIRKVGKQFYHDLRSANSIPDSLTERQLSKKQATKLIGGLVAEVEKQKADDAPTWEDGFEIETYYNTTMVTETSKDLLDWAEKRFKNDPLSLKQIKEFLADGERISVAVPGYKIKPQY